MPLVEEKRPFFAPVTYNAGGSFHGYFDAVLCISAYIPGKSLAGFWR